MPYKGNSNLPLTRPEAGRCLWEDVRDAYWGLASDQERADYRQKAGGKAITISTPHFPSPDMWICLQAPGQGFGCWWDPQQKGFLELADAKLELPVTDQVSPKNPWYHEITVEGANISVNARMDASQIDELIKILSLYKDYLAG